VTVLPEREQPEEGRDKVDVRWRHVGNDNACGIRRAAVPNPKELGKLATYWHWVRVVYLDNGESSAMLTAGTPGTTATPAGTAPPTGP
jgi:hypothetical protein